MNRSLPPPERRAGRIAWLSGICLLAGALSQPVQAARSWVYFGDAGMKPDSAIYASAFDSDTGALGEPLAVAPAWNPVFLATDPTHQFLYAITGEAVPHKLPLSRLKAFRIDPGSGALSLLTDLRTKDLEACHLLVSPDDRVLFLANYLDGTVSTYALNPDGTLGPRVEQLHHSGTGADASRQEAPHAHCVNLDPTGRYLISNDLGADKIYVYRFDQTHGTITPAQPAFIATQPGSGPRHFAFLPSGRFAYAVTELSSNVITLGWDSDHGRLSVLHTQSILAPDFKGQNLAAEISFDPAGRYLYLSNRGEDTIVVFAVDARTGALTFVQRMHQGINLPRNFAIDPTGHWMIVANTGSDSVDLYRVDPQTGRLTWTGTHRKVPKPLCVVFVPRS